MKRNKKFGAIGELWQDGGRRYPGCCVKGVEVYPKYKEGVPYKEFYGEA